MANKQLQLSMAAVLAASVVVTALPATVAEAATYKDVPKTSQHYEAIYELSERGLIQGYADKTFKPNAKITRGHIATILQRMLDLQPDQSVKFSDVSNSHDFYKVASAVVGAGLMTTHNGKFDSKEYLTRYEYAEILTKAFELKALTNSVPFKDVSSANRVKVQAVYDHGIMKGKTATKFDGFSNLTRAQAAATLYRTIQMQEAKEKPGQVVTKKKITLSTVSLSYAFTDDGEFYKIPTALASIINSSNASALKDAELEIQLTNGEWTGINKLTLNANGTTYTQKTLDGSGKSYSFPIVMNGTNLSLQNMTLDEVTVGDDAYYQAVLQNVNVKKQVKVEDGYTSSFALRFINSTIPYAAVNRDNTTIESSNAIPQLFLDEEAYDVTLNSSVGQLQLVRDGYVTLKGSGTIEKLLIPVETDLYLNNTGYIKEIVVNDADSWIRLGTKVSIGSATIPTHADYTSVFSYSGALKSLVSKVNYPNSTLNLLSNTVVKPSKEELAYQNALANVIQSYDSSLTGTTMSMRTKFNEIPATLKNLSFDQMIRIDDRSLNVSTIPVVVKKGGLEKFKGNIEVSRLQSGVSLQSLIGDALTLKDFTSGGEANYSISFDTDVEFTVNAAVYVNGTWKAATQQRMNTGYNDRYSGYVNAAITGYNLSTATNVLTSEISTGTIDPLIRDAKVDQFIKLNTDYTDSTTLPITIKKGGSSIFTGDVSVASLKSGVYVSNLPNAVQETLANFNENGQAEYTIEVGTTRELAFETQLYVNGVQKGATQTENVNSGINETIADLYAPSTYSKPTPDSLKVEMTPVATIPDTIKNYAVDYRLQLTEAVVNHTGLVKLQVKYAGSSYTIQVPQDELEAGINLLDYVYASSQSSVVPLTVAELNDGETVEVSFISPIKGKVTMATLIGNNQKGDSATHDIVKMSNVNTVANEQVKTPTETTHFFDQFSVGTSANSVTVKTKFNANVAHADYQNKYVDGRLKVTNGLYRIKDDKKLAVSVYYEGRNVAAFKQISVADLKKGVFLSDVLGEKRALISNHTAREDKWDIVVEDLSDMPLDITVDLIVSESDVTVAADRATTMQPAATIDHTINKELSQAFNDSVQSFKLTRNNKTLVTEAQFTSTASTNANSEYEVDYVLLPVDVGTVGTSYTASKIGYGYGANVDPYKSNVTLTRASLVEGLSTLGYVIERRNATGIGPNYIYLNYIAGSTQNWTFEFTTAVPAMKAYLIVDSYKVDEVTETP